VDAMPEVCPKEVPKRKPPAGGQTHCETLSTIADNFDEKPFVKSRPPRRNQPKEMMIMPQVAGTQGCVEGPWSVELSRMISRPLPSQPSQRGVCCLGRSPAEEGGGDF